MKSPHVSLSAVPRSGAGCRIWRRAALLGAWVGLAVSVFAGDPRTMRIGVKFNAPPFYFINAQGVPDGFTVELVNTVSRKAGIKYELVPGYWIDVMREFDAGRIDVLANMVITPERREKMDFSVGHGVIHAVTYARPGTPPARRLADLTGKTMAVLTGSAADETVHAYHAWGAHVVGYASKTDMLRAVKEGRCDLALFIQPTEDTPEEIALRLERVFVEDLSLPLHFAVHRGDAARLALLNEGLTLAMQDDSFDRIYSKWVGPIEPRPIRLYQLRRYYWQIALGILVLAGAFAWRQRVALERRRLLRRLQQQESDLIEAQRLGNLGSWTLDAAAEKVTWTPPLYRMFGLDPTQPAPDLAQQERLFTPESWKLLSAAVAETLQHGRPYELELEVVSPVEGVRYMIGRGEAIRDALGRTTGVHGIAQNITARKLNEEKLRRLSQLYAALSHCSEAIVRCSDEKSLFQENCRGAVEIGGLALAWVGTVEPGSDRIRVAAAFGSGSAYLESAVVMTSPDSPLGRGPTGRAIRENHPMFCQDFQHDPMTAPWHKVGAEYGLRASAAVPLTRGGKVVGCFTLYSRELAAFDETVSALVIRLAGNISYALDNLEREAARSRFQAEVDLQSAALNATSNTVVITDLKGRIEWVNPAFTKSTGYRSEEVIGRNPRILKSGHQSDAYYAEMWRTISAGRSWSGEFVNVRKDGGLYTEEVTITPVRDRTGAITHFVAVKQDISEKISLQKQLYETQRVESIGLLASGIAHDLNNILAPITLAMSLLRMKYPNDSHLLEVTEKCAQRGANIVRQVLTFARGGDGRPASVKVGRLVKEMVRLLAETLPRNIALTYELETEADFVCVDSTQLHQVLLNLAVNARDAMPHGGKLTFTVGHREISEDEAKHEVGAAPASYVTITVADTGSGIAPEIIAKVFDPFFTTKPRGHGTGLGLSTVQGIVRGASGFIRVKSELGQGTEFQVFLPAVPAPTTEAAAPAPSGKVGHGELVLVVDDEATILEVTRLILEQNGYTCVVASDGSAALEVFRAQLDRIKLVILDRMMPGMNGEAAARAMHDLAPSIPIFLATGLVGDRGSMEKESGIAGSGIRAVLKKPFTEESLLKVLHDALHPGGSRPPMG